MNIPSMKLISALVSVGGLATGTGVGIYFYLNNKETKNISQWLESDGFLVLKESEDDTQWKSNWSAFIDANNSKTILESGWDIQSWTTKKSNKGEVPADFKTNCKKNSELKIDKKTDEKYEKVKKYCTKPKG